MPQLPSGRHIALGRDPLERLVEGIKDNVFITKILVIEQRQDLYPYIDLLFLQEERCSATPEYAKGSLPVSADLKAFPSGYTLATMAPEVESWSVADQRALADFLAAERTCCFLDTTLRWVRDQKRRLADDPRFLVRYQAGMWLAGIHYIQTEREDGENHDDGQL